MVADAPWTAAPTGPGGGGIVITPCCSVPGVVGRELDVVSGRVGLVVFGLERPTTGLRFREPLHDLLVALGIRRVRAL